MELMLNRLRAAHRSFLEREHGLHPNLLVIHPEALYELREDLGAMSPQSYPSLALHREVMGMAICESTDVRDFRVAYSPPTQTD